MIPRQLPPYRASLAGRLLAARDAVMAPILPILRDAGITEQQWRVLRVLIDEGSMDLSTLAGNALLRPPSVTRILKELQTRELVTRELDPLDARRSIVAITDTGRALVDETTDATLTMLDRYAEAFGVERLRALLAELALLTATVADRNRLTSDD